MSRNHDGAPLLKERAYTAIKGRILDGSLPPGGFLAERALALELKMSKTPVRAAIGRLEAEGFVTVSPQQGIVVREPSFREIVDHFDTRIALETYVVGQIARRGAQQRATEITRNLQEQRDAAEAGDVQRYVALDSEFHLLLASQLGNAEIRQLLARQFEKLARTVHRVFSHDPSRLAASTAEHEELWEKIQAREGDAAEELVRRHLEFGKSYLVA